jgi:hypothetical protein
MLCGCGQHSTYNPSCSHAASAKQPNSNSLVSLLLHVTAADIIAAHCYQHCSAAAAVAHLTPSWLASSFLMTPNRMSVFKLRS